MKLEMTLKKKRNLILTSTIFTTLILLLHGCGDTTKPAAEESRFTTLYRTTFTSCKNCHVPGTETYNVLGVKLDFSTKELARTSLTTYKSVDPTNGICTGIYYATANSPSESYLLPILIESYRTANFGKSGCTPTNVHTESINLSTSEKSSLVAWINEGTNL